MPPAAGRPRAAADLDTRTVETPRHRRLKRLAVQWLLQLGCRAVAVEVACPLGRFRVDAAGWLDHCESDALPPPQPLAPDVPAAEPPSLFAAARRRRGPAMPRTIVVECKQSRSDFFRNRGEGEALAAQLATLRRRARRIEETRIKAFEPQLRRVEAGLFETEEHWDFASSRIGAYHRLQARIGSIERDLYGRSKFERLRVLGLADHVFVLCPRGMLQPRELPRGLGLLECPTSLLRSPRRAAAGTDGHAAAGGGSPSDGPGEAIDATSLRRRCDAARLAVAAPRRIRMLRNIAVAATREAWREAWPRPSRGVAGDAPGDAPGDARHAPRP